jgi:hypothetical protein
VPIAGILLALLARGGWPTPGALVGAGLAIAALALPLRRPTRSPGTISSTL